MGAAQDGAESGHFYIAMRQTRSGPSTQTEGRRGTWATKCLKTHLLVEITEAHTHTTLSSIHSVSGDLLEMVLSSAMRETPK